MVGALVNVVSKEEYVKKIERFYRLIKERARCYRSMTPFECVPRALIIQLLKIVTLYANDFAWKQGVLHVTLPLAIIKGIVLDHTSKSHAVSMLRLLRSQPTLWHQEQLMQ